MNISIVIPAFDEEKVISSTLGKIKKACADLSEVEWEYIVCDNNSNDRTAQKAKEAGAVVVPEAIHQISRARNTGASIAKGDWLLFIDADSYPSKELMSDVVEVVRQGTFVGCGSTVEVEGGSLFNKLRMERLNPLFRLCNFCGGAFILVNKPDFDAIGGFSTKLYAYEEVDFVWRLKRQGRKKGKKFTVLNQHPVTTSGRKGDYTFSAMFALFVSSFSAILFFLFRHLLPHKLTEKLKTSLFAYWYKGRR